MSEVGLGQAIREDRRARGLTMSGLARALDCSAWTVGQWERGRARPSPPLARALRFTLPELVPVLDREARRDRRALIAWRAHLLAARGLITLRTV